MIKKILLFLFFLSSANSLLGQNSGNVNYFNVRNKIASTNKNTDLDVRFASYSHGIISIKGLANVKADSYVAIFSVSQVGKTAAEVNQLLDERINQAVTSIKTKPNVKVYIDMISFVPVYEYKAEKKIFSKKTYNEIPAGFELKKNIHIGFSNPDLLNEIIANFANFEIYDLVKVDYISSKIESVKKELMVKAKTLLEERVKNYQSILLIDMDSTEKNMIDGFKVVFPVEMYKSYRAYNSSSLSLKKTPNANNTAKSRTLYYESIPINEYDFVINPVIIEPVIQVMYQVKLRIKNEVVEQKNQTNYMLITPNGELKQLKVGN